MALSAVAGGVFLASTYSSIKANKAAAKEQGKAADRDRRIAEVRNAKERRQAIAQSRISAGQASNAAAVAGAGGSSGAAGAVAGIRGDTAGNIGMQQTVSDLNTQRLSFLDAANANTALANTYSQVANAAASVGGADFSFLQNIKMPGFGGGTATAPSAPQGAAVNGQGVGPVGGTAPWHNVSFIRTQ